MATSFGERMAETRKYRKLSQKNVSDYMKTDVSLISKYERNLITPTIETAKRIAECLTISLDYLVGLDNDTTIKDRDVSERYQKVCELPQEKQQLVLNLIDTVIRDSKVETAFSS